MSSDFYFSGTGGGGGAGCCFGDAYILLFRQKGGKGEREGGRWEGGGKEKDRMKRIRRRGEKSSVCGRGGVEQLEREERVEGLWGG